MGALVILGVLIASGVASALGLTVDSRDPRYGVGAVMTWTTRSPLEQERENPGERRADAAEAA
jgi:hypothetical protein